jgi:hypothetical protein
MPPLSVRSLGAASALSWLSTVASMRVGLDMTQSFRRIERPRAVVYEIGRDDD